MAAALRGACIGAGYFSAFHFRAWLRLPTVAIVAVCERDPQRAAAARTTLGDVKVYSDVAEMLDREKLDFIDVITPPATHAAIVAAAAARGVHVICQKPLAPSYDEARAIVDGCQQANVRMMVHENFRFQPWHRQIRRMIEHGEIGQVHTLACRCRMGDGWGEDAYLARQPYFRDYSRLFMYETGVHFIDVYRYLAGEITRVTAWHRRLNPVIRGEDAATVVFEFAHGALGQLDANRYNEPVAANVDPRYTFGTFLIEGDRGGLSLDTQGQLTLRQLGEQPQAVPYLHERRDFAGDCVYYTQRHFAECMLNGATFETDGRDYLKTLAVQEAVYASAASRTPVTVDTIHA